MLVNELESQGNWLFKQRGVLPIFILIPALIVYYFQVKNNPSDFVNDTSIYPWICLMIALMGLLIRIYTVGHTPSGTSGRNTHGQVAEELNTTGIYSQLRHPLYLGNFFMWLGPAMLTCNVWFIAFFIVSYMFYYERIMYAEEQFLHKKYGANYKTWADKIPCIIPKMNAFVSPKYSFNIWKILRQEKTGFLLLFLVFLLFYRIQKFALGEAIDFQNIWFYMFLASILVYIFIKLLSKTSFWKEVY